MIPKETFRCCMQKKRFDEFDVLVACIFSPGQFPRCLNIFGSSFKTPMAEKIEH